MKTFMTILLCAVTSSAISHGNEATVLLNLATAGQASGNVYDGVYWNSLTTDTGTGTEIIPDDEVVSLFTSSTLDGNFNATVADHCGMEVGKLYSSTGFMLLNNLTCTITISLAFDDDSGIGSNSGTSGTTPTVYQSLPSDVTSSAIALTNASFTITLGGLSANQTYTLTLGGNSGLNDSSDFDFYFSTNDATNLEGTGGEAESSLFTVGDESAYALKVDLTADENGDISFVGYGQTNVNITYMSLSGDWNLVPEPSSYSLGLFSLAGLALRRRRA